MKNVLSKILNLRLWPLLVKEFPQISRNTRLVILLIIPPTLNIVLFGLALNPTFENLRLGVVDYSRTPESRELVSAFTEGLAFETKSYYSSTEELGQAISRGELDAGLVMPRDFAEKRERRETVEVQLLVDAVNANTATIAGGYAARIIASLNQRIARSQPPRQPPTGNPPDAAPVSLATKAGSGAAVTPRLTLLYNPGLESAWFITTGMIGLLLVLQGSVVSSASLVREKEIGTVEQLLMTPAESSEIIVAKVAPIFRPASSAVVLRCRFPFRALAK